MPTVVKSKRKSKRYQYRVFYQRKTWQQSKARAYQTELLAERFARLLIESQFQYGELKFVRIDRREVQPWAFVRELKPGAFHGWWTPEALRANGMRGQS